MKELHKEAIKEAVYNNLDNLEDIVNIELRKLEPVITQEDLMYARKAFYDKL